METDGIAAFADTLNKRADELRATLGVDKQEAYRMVALAAALHIPEHANLRAAIQDTIDSIAGIVAALNWQAPRPARHRRKHNGRLHKYRR